MYDHNKELFLD